MSLFVRYMLNYRQKSLFPLPSFYSQEGLNPFFPTPISPLCYGRPPDLQSNFPPPSPALSCCSAYDLLLRKGGGGGGGRLAEMRCLLLPFPFPRFFHGVLIDNAGKTVPLPPTYYTTLYEWNGPLRESQVSHPKPYDKKRLSKTPLCGTAAWACKIFLFCYETRYAHSPWAILNVYPELDLCLSFLVRSPGRRKKNFP